MGKEGVHHGMTTQHLRRIREPGKGKTEKICR